MSTPITAALLIANIGIFFLQLQAPDGLFTDYALWPLGAGFQWWQVVSSAFLHGSWLHLGVNMFGIWVFGRDIERALGPWVFLRLYLVSVLAAAATQLVVVSLGDPAPTVGASGGLFGLLAAFAMLFPQRKMFLLFLPIPLPAPIFVALYAGFELYAGITSTQSGIAHFAHLGGLIGGLTVLHRMRRARLKRL